MKRTFSLSLAVLVCSSGIWAQAGAGWGAVSGIVKEAGGDGIPDTTVVLSNPALGLRRVMTTTDDGLFTAPALNPSAGYRLKITSKGFVDWDSVEFEVSIGQTVNFQVILRHEAASTQAEDNNIPAPQMRDLKAGTANLVTRAQIDSLPANRRRADPLVQMRPRSRPMTAPDGWCSQGSIASGGAPD